MQSLKIQPTLGLQSTCVFTYKRDSCLHQNAFYKFILRTCRGYNQSERQCSDVNVRVNRWNIICWKRRHRLVSAMNIGLHTHTISVNFTVFCYATVTGTGLIQVLKDMPQSGTSAGFWLGGQCPLAAWGEENFENLTTKWCILKYIWINMWSA